MVSTTSAANSLFNIPKQSYSKTILQPKKILNATSALECKSLSREIDNFDKSTWESCAKERCMEGIRQKFAQNSALKDVLVHCTVGKTIIESTSDSFWGSGVPLHRHDCLNPRQWLSKGIMSEILMDITDELKTEITHQSHPQSTPYPTNQDPAKAEAAHTELVADMETR